jgi:hypothetical protein
MKETQPSIEDWKALYDSAIEFRNLECWSWMYDSHIFGVQDPSSREIGYCCIMGNLGEFMALAVYLGTKGLEGYCKTQSGLLENKMEALTIQKCLMASFEDRNELTDKDRQIIKELGLKFRGNKEWPLFRNYDPGYYPWYLNMKEVQYLTLALQQAMEVAVKFKENPDELIPTDENYFVRVPRKTQAGLKWSDKWMKPKPLEGPNPDDVIPKIEESSLEEVKDNIKYTNNVWEVDAFRASVTVSEKQGSRPYYPFMMLVVDSDARSPINFGFTDPWNYRAEFISKFLDSIVNFGIPSEVKVRRREVYDLLSIIAEQLDIELTLVRRLKIMEEVEDFVLGRLT